MKERVDVQKTHVDSAATTTSSLLRNLPAFLKEI